MPSSLDFSGNPLVNDDRTLPRASPLDFSGSPAGLDLSRQTGATPSLQGMPQGIDFNAATQQMQSILRAPTAQPAPRSTEAPIYFSPSTGEMVVNGFTFNQRNATQALVSEQFANQPRQQFTLPDTASDWREMPRDEYAAYLNTIKNPTYGRRMGEAWENAWRGMGDIAVGAGLAADRALTGDEDNQWLIGARANLTREFEENAPFMMQLRDIQNPSDALTYFSQMLVQGAPWLVETAVSMGVGGLIGGAVSGGVGAPAGAIEAFTAKEALREASRQLLRNNLARGARAYEQALARRIATQHAETALTREEVVRLTGANADDVNRFFNFGERAYHMSRTGVGGSGMAQTGAVVGMSASNYATGVGDIRNSIADAGGDPESADAVANIWGLAVPYAFVESMGDLLVTQPVSRLLPGLANGPTRIGNALTHAGMVGAAEGVEEGSQYIITQQGVAGATNTPINIEPMDLLESVVGGAIAGAGLGGVTGALGRPNRRTNTSTAGGATATPIAGLTPDGPMQGPDTAVGPQGTDYHDEYPAYMGGLETPDIDPNYGNGGEDTRFDITGRPVTGTNPAAREAEALRNTLNTPDLSNTDRQNIQQGVEALSPRDEINYEAAQRGAAQVGEGVRSTYVPGPTVEPQIDLPASEVQDLTSAPPIDTTADDIPPGLSQLPRPARSRPLTEIWQDLAQGNPVEVREIAALKQGIRELQQANPTNPGFTDVINQLDRIEAEMTVSDYTDTDSEGFKQRFPELNRHLEQNPPKNTPSPMDAARPPVPAVPRIKINPDGTTGTYVRPADDLRGTTEDTTGPDYIAEATAKGAQQSETDRIAAKRKKKNQRRSAQRKAERARNREQRERTAPAKIRELAERTEAPVKKTGKISDDITGMTPKAASLKLGKGLNHEDVEEIRDLESRPTLNARQRKQLDALRYLAGYAPSVVDTNNTRMVNDEFAEKVLGRTQAEQEASAKRNPNYDPEKADRIIKENKNAIPERSTKAVSKEEQPATVQPTASRDTSGDRVAAESTDTKGTESVQSAEVNQDRVAKAKEALLEAAEDRKKNPKQMAANAALQLSKERQVRQPWFYANGDALTHAELVALIESFGKQTKAEKPKVSSKSKAAELFHSYVVDEWKNSKDPATGSKETFKTFVLENRIAIQDWIDTPLVSGRIAAARKTAQEILEANPRKTDETDRKPQRATNGRPRGSTTATRILRRVLKENPDFTFKPVHPATRERNLKVLDEINAAREPGEREINVIEASDYLSHLKKRMREEDPQRATGERLPRQVFDSRTPDGNTKLYVNPTRDDVMRMTRTPLGQDSFKYDMVRFVKDANGNVFAANGYYFIHDQIVDFMEDHGVTVVGYEADNNLTQDGHGSRVVASSVVRKGDKLRFSTDADGNALSSEEDLWPKKSTSSVRGQIYRTVSQAEARSTVNKVQRNISQDVKFKTTHIMGDVLDVFNRGNEEMMTAPNGAQVSLMSYIMRQAAIMKLENPEMKTLNDETVAAFYVQEFMQAKAFVVPGYQALFVFSNYMKDTRDLVETLEHEYVVHAGLKAMYPDRTARELFLKRFGKIPGVEEMRLHLLAVKPEYSNVPLFDQLEELIAYHSMHGPLALERLLSAEEGISQETRRTLWEDLKQMVADWIAKVFGGTSTKSNEAVMDDIVAALREHSIVGSTGDLMSILDKHGAPALSQEERDSFYEINEGPIKRAVADAVTSTPAETQAKLFGTDTNPMRPYKSKNAVNDAIETLRGVEPLIDKLQEMRGRNIGTPVKEGLAKVGREIVTMNDMALKSVLIEKMMRIMHNTIKYARDVMTRIQEQRQYAVKSAKTARIRALWGDTFPGSTPEQLEAYNRMAMVATNNRIATLSDAEVRNAPRLRVRNLDGTYTINMDVYKEMLKRGTLSKEEYENGVEQFTVDKRGEVVSAGVAKLDKKLVDLGYEMYVNETRLMAESSLKTLEAMNEALSMRNEQSIAQILDDIDFAEKDKPFVTEALQRMRKLYADIAFHNYETASRDKRFTQQETARQVLVELQRAFHEELKVADWTDSRATRKEGANPRANDAFKWREQVDPHDDVKPFVNQIRWFLEYDDTFGGNRMEQINSLGVSKDQQYGMMNVFQALINAETQAHELENDVIQSVMGNYVEMTRKGEWRVALEVRGTDGKEFTNINPELLAVLPVTYAETKREAIALQKEWMEEFAGKHTVHDAEGKGNVEVTFDVSVAIAPGTKTMGDAPKVREFLKVAELAGMTLKPHQMKVIANLIESAATRKRLGLQRAGTPGADINIIQNNSETMTRRAWQAAKTSQAWALESTMTDRKNQYGDWDKLALLQRNFDVANRGAPEGSAPPVTFIRNEAAVIVAEKALLRYAEQLRHMARHTVGRPTVNIRTTAGEKKLKITGEAEAFNVHAQALKASLEKGDVEVNLNDMLSKTGALRQMAVVSQLGTIAAGIMNMFTPLTHLPWRLTANHKDTGYGEGFSMTEVTSEIVRAVSQVGNLMQSLADSAKLRQLLDDAKAGNNKTNLTVAELEALYEETLNGVLMPQQTYSLTGGTESNITNLLARNLATMFLGPFSATEASTRRVAFLASYRLMKARYIAAGVSEAALNDSKSPEYKKMMEDIERVVFDTQGDYSNVNRPRSFRGDWAQYILQYKMFPLNTVLLIKNLPKKEQAMMLGAIFLLSGLKGEPFADDFADIYDTLLQNLGFKHDSVELQLTRTLEDIMPGLSTWVMHGGIDNFIPIGATLSSRLSMGDIIPLTGVLRPEADLGRELTNALGPAFAANMAAVEWAATVADFSLQVAGAKPRTTSAVELIRRFPQGQIRALTEAGMMASSGQIVDPQGRLTSDEVTWINVFSRALSFYPLEASKANNAVRLDRMHTEYMRGIRARFVLAYANAYRQNDRDEMERINDAVNDWNDAVEQTGQEDMEIRNFRRAAIRAGRAASSTTVERTAEGAPDYSRIEEIAGILNADEESE